MVARRFVTASVISLVIICTSICSVCVESLSSSKSHYLTISEMKKYDTVLYSDLKSKPKSYLKSGSIRIPTVFMGEMTDLPNDIQTLFKKSTYYFLKIPKEEMAGNYPIEQIIAEDMYYRFDRYRDRADFVPILTSRSKRKKVVDMLDGLKLGTRIALYGEVKKTSKKRGMEHLPDYHFYVEDAYTLDEEAKLNPGIAASGSTPDASADATALAGNAEYKDINPDNLDLEAEKYVGKYVRFKTFYAGRDSSMPYSLAKFFPIEKYFRIISPSYSLANFYIIAEKTEANVQKILSLNTTDEITISGQLLKILNSSDSATYYIKVDKVETDKAPAEEAETEDEGETEPEEKKDDALVMPWNK